MSIEVMNQDVRSRREIEALEIDAEALIDELLLSDLPHDPPVDAIADPRPLEVEPCPVCDGTQVLPKYSIRGTSFRLVVCADCGLGTLHPKPTPRQIARFYPSEYYGSPGAKFTPLVETMVRSAAARTARQLTKHLPAGSRVLDVGCGRGVLLSALADLGMESHGFEISRTAAEGIDARAAVRIAPSLEQADYPQGHFDLIVLCHVLEHLPDPQSTLSEIRRLLKPGGTLVVSVPNFSSWQAQSTGRAWFHLDLPRHLFHFPASALREFLERTGFSCRREEYFSLSQNPFGWVQSLLNRWSTGPRNALYSQLKKTPSKAASSWWKTLGLRLAYWLGMPMALGLSLVCAAFRRGATITIIAQSPAEEAGMNRDLVASSESMTH